MDLGILPEFLPGYKETATSANGAGVPNIRQGMESGDIKALYLLGGDIRKEMALLGLPPETLKGLQLLVVQDVFGGPMDELAHVVLPAASFAEREGSYTNACRIVQKSDKAIEPLGQSRSDLEIISQLGKRLGLAPLDSVEAARAQIAQSVPIYDFISSPGQLADGQAWDYGKVASRARNKLSLVVEGCPQLDETYSFLLTFDNALHYGGSSTLQSPSLAKLRVDDALEISEDDAKALGIEDGAVVAVKVNNGGSIKLRARISGELPARVVSVPSHNLQALQALVGKLDVSLLRAEEGTPAWTASVMPAKG